MVCVYSIVRRSRAVRGHDAAGLFTQAKIQKTDGLHRFILRKSRRPSLSRPPFAVAFLPCRGGRQAARPPHLKKIHYFCTHRNPNSLCYVCHRSIFCRQSAPPHVEQRTVAARPLARRSLRRRTDGGCPRLCAPPPLRKARRQWRRSPPLRHLSLLPHGGTLCAPRFAFLVSCDPSEKRFEHVAGGERLVDHRVACHAHRRGVF